MTTVLTSEVHTAVERLGHELNDIRRSAEEREAAAKSDLDAETPAFQRKFRAIRERMKQLQEQMKTCQQEEDAACQRQTEIEEAYEISVQHRRKVSAFPNTQNLLDFIFGGYPAFSNHASPVSPSSARSFLDLSVETAGHANDLALVAGKQTPYRPASPASIPTSPAKRPAEDAPEKPDKRIRNATSAMESVEKTVDFDELYDDGNARYKHTIVQYNKEWFILKCDEHNIHFPYRAVLAAGSHLKAYAHNGPSAALPAVVEAFGVRVIGCDKEKADMNNESFKRALKDGYQVLKSAKRHDAPGGMRTDESDPIEEIVVACQNGSSSIADVRFASVTTSDTASLLDDTVNAHCDLNGVADALGIDNGREQLTAAIGGTNPSAGIECNQQRKSAAEEVGRKEAWNAINRNIERSASPVSAQTWSVKTAYSQADGSLGADQEGNAAGSGQWWQVVA